MTFLEAQLEDRIAQALRHLNSACNNDEGINHDPNIDRAIKALLATRPLIDAAKRTGRA